MDSGWAVVIGAGVALMGSVFAPWLKDSLERRHRLREANRSAIAACLLKVSSAAPQIALARLAVRKSAAIDPAEKTVEESFLHTAKHFEAHQAVFELGLLLPKREALIETMARMVINAANEDDFFVEVSTFNKYSALWYRKELTPEAALSGFISDVDEYRAMKLGSDAEQIASIGSQLEPSTSPAER